MLVVSLFLLWFLFEEVQEIWKKRLEYFFDFWNIVDWAPDRGKRAPSARAVRHAEKCHAETEIL